MISSSEISALFECQSFIFFSYHRRRQIQPQPEMGPSQIYRTGNNVAPTHGPQGSAFSVGLQSIFPLAFQLHSAQLVWFSFSRAALL